MARRCGAFLWLMVAGCFPVPGDWTGGFTGDYLCTGSLRSSRTSGSGAPEEDRTDADSFRLTIESAADGTGGYVVGVACDAVPVRWSFGSLELDGKPSCTGKYTTSTTYRSDSTTTWRSLTVTRTGPDSIAVDGEFEREETSTLLGLGSVTRTTTRLDLTGRRIGRE